MRQAKEAGANIQTLFAKGAGPTGTGGSIPSISNQKISDTNTSSNMQAISAAQINNATVAKIEADARLANTQADKLAGVDTELALKQIKPGKHP